MVTLHAKGFMKAPPADVWAVFTELEGWTYWAGVGQVTREQPGRDELNGVGAIRATHLVGPPIREQVTVFEPHSRYGYTLLSGAPIKDHAGEVVFEERPHGTVVRWTVNFKPTVPGTGWVIGKTVELALKHILSRLNNRMAPLEDHRVECPYADSQDAPSSYLLKGRRAIARLTTPRM